MVLIKRLITVLGCMAIKYIIITYHFECQLVGLPGRDEHDYATRAKNVSRYTE